MAVYLSPGVFPREIDLSVLPASIGPMRPGFIGTTKKGPMNEPTFIANASQFIDTFGEPFPESYLGYAVLAYLEEGNGCYVMRVGVECKAGQPDELATICVDTSGSKGSGWGRIPLFTGIDNGRITLSEIGDGVGENPSPFVFHDAAINSIEFSDADVSSTDGPTTATLNTLGSYTGNIDDSYVLIITDPPNLSDDASVSGAGFQIIRNSDGEIIAEGDLTDDAADGTSQFIDTGDGFSVQVDVSAGVLDVNDTFTWSVQPDNRDFEVSVDGGASVVYSMPVASYSTVADFIAAANALLSSEDYSFVSYTLDDGVTVVPQIRTDVAGERVQLLGTSAFALEVGVQQYAYDIPRSYLIGLDDGPHDITTQNNRVKIDVIGPEATETIEFSLPSGLGQTTESIAAVVDAAGIAGGEVLWNAFALTVPGGLTHLVIETSAGHSKDMLELQSNFSNIKTLRFAEEFEIVFPYKRSYRGFKDNRSTLPDGGESDPAIPLSCELNPSGSDCSGDTSYYENIVGWLVAPSAGTWVSDYTVTLSLYTEGVGDASGRYSLTIRGSQGEVLDNIEDVTFDKRNARYIGNVINPGSSVGGNNGNAFLNWDERPSYLDNDLTSSFEVRLPSQFSNRSYVGQANGIPTDPVYSLELDSAVIGNPATATGLYAFQNPESIDINILLTPGFTTGSIIGTALQICESRGDALYIVDPPFGLRPSEVIDWHNGMLLSDLQSSINSSYGALYWGWIKYFDQFSNTEIWIPPSGHVAAVYSRTARETEKWYAPAGTRRGRLLTALDVEYSPTQVERDRLYGSGNSINPIVSFPQTGITVWGQRTLDRSTSVTNRVNVRLLLNDIKKTLTNTLNNFVFEPNDPILWRQVQATVEPLISEIQSRRGIDAYRVIVDDTNNTPERVARNELWVSVIVRPTAVTEFIVLNVVTLRSGGTFSSDEVLAAAGVVQ